MDRSPLPIAYLPIVFICLFVGGGGLLILLSSVEPSIGPRWLFYFFVVVAFTGVFLPFSALLNQRFPTHPPASADAVLREALMGGIYIAILAWLSNGRVISLGLASIFLISMAGIELFWRIWEHSQWRRS